MLLTLWRHGEAGSAATDEVRALTPRGREEVVAMARDYVAWTGESALGPVSLLLHSPYRRTVETAALLGEVLGPRSLKADPSLAPGAHPEAFSENDYTGHEHIVMVSHQPFVSQAIAHWTDDMSLAPLAPGVTPCWRSPVFHAVARRYCDIVPILAISRARPKYECQI